MSGAVDTAVPRSTHPPRRLGGFLRESLQPFPGRAEASLRMTLACLVIIAISMTLQIPSPALAAYMVFFVSREDMATTAKTGIALILAVTIAIGLTILCFQATVNQPVLRLACMAVLFALGMYVSRIFVLGALGFGLGFILLITQSTVDLYPSGEMLLRDTLWTWAALSFSITVVIVVNVLVLPARPLELLRQEVIFRLRFVADATASLSAARPSATAAVPPAATPPAAPPLAVPAPPALPAAAMRALDPVRAFALMKLAASKGPDLARKLPAYSAALAALGRLVEAACMLAALPMRAAPGIEARLQRLRAACLSMADAVAHREAVAHPETATLPAYVATEANLASGPAAEDQEALPPAAAAKAYGTPPSSLPAPAAVPKADTLLHEMEAEMADILQHWQAAQRGEPVEPPPPPAKPALFVPDARSNPVYQQFALKVTFAAMLCYVLYTGLAWPGIHTCVVTCAVIALTTSGSTVHKATLRMLGALAGGALALLATVFIVPHLESLGGLLLLVAPVALAAAWISAGGERIAYFGWQLAFAFFLCILHGFQPSTDVTVVRDRLIGVLLGTAVTGLVFHYVWPERAADQLYRTLARILRNARSRSVLQDLRAASRQAQDAAFEVGVIQPTRVDALFAATQAVALGCLHSTLYSPELDAALRQYAAHLESGAPLPALPSTDDPALQARLQWLHQMLS